MISYVIVGANDVRLAGMWRDHDVETQLQLAVTAELLPDRNFISIALGAMCNGCGRSVQRGSNRSLSGALLSDI